MNILRSVKMLLASNLHFLVFLVIVFRHALADNTFGSHTEREARCDWNCTVVESDLMALKEEMKTSITKNKLMRLVVTYKNTVDDTCAKQTFRNTTEHCQICFFNKKTSTYAKVIESLASLIVVKEFKEVKAVCNLYPARTKATGQTYYRGFSSIFSRGALADLGGELACTDFIAGETDHLRSCMNITSKSNGINSTISEGSLEPGGWPMAVLYCLYFVFNAVFIHYSLAFLCLFSPTEVTDDGVRQIILEGASPVSFRSLMGNFFFSGDEGIMWHKAKTFILRVVFIPLPFLGPAIYIYFEFFGSVSEMHYLELFIPMLCCTCYCIHAFYVSFYRAPKSFKPKPCSVCKFFKPRTVICEDKLPRMILSHLRLQPLILVECWRLFIWCLLKYLKISVNVFPSCKLSLECLLRFFIFTVLLCTIPAVLVILLTAVFILALIAILLTSPVAILCSLRKLAIDKCSIFVGELAIRYFVTLPAGFGALSVLTFASTGTFLAFLSIFALLFNEDSLPYVACFVLVLYYICSSYTSFTNKYHELALALFKRYRVLRHDQFKDMPLSTDKEQNVPISADYNENIIKIPKELFDIACEELMPIREGVCKLILKITIILLFVLIVFWCTMLSTVGTAPILKALLAFLTLSFPKIVAIYVDGGWQKKLQAMVFDEKVPKIVEQFINGTFGSIREQENSSTNVDEVMLLNEEGIELVNM